MKPEAGQAHYLTSLAIILGFAGIVLFRLPNVVLEGGRLWSEEGVVYFHNAWYYPWYAAWFTVHTGYINFIAAFATWASLQIAGIAHAPAVTVLFALLIQCLPVYLIITRDFPWRNSILATLSAVSLCAFQPFTAEVWLNTITSQFHLALCGALIFASSSRIKKHFYVDCLILILGTLSGPVTCFLFPLFALIAVLERNRQSVIKAAIVFSGFCVQFALYCTSDHSIRGDRLSPDALLSVISLHTIILQFVGVHLASLFSQYLAATYSAHDILWCGPAVFLLFYGIIGAAIWQTKNLILAKLTAAGVVISLLSFYEALGGDFASFAGIEFGERYAFVPMVINGLLITGLASSNHRIAGKSACVALCALILIGITNYRSGTSRFENGPAWGPQMIKWRQNSERVLFVWPDTTWPTRLVADHKSNP